LEDGVIEPDRVQLISEALAQQVDFCAGTVNSIQAVATNQHHWFTEGRRQYDRDPSVLYDDVDILRQFGLEI
jgi:hypothetical protein